MITRVVVTLGKYRLVEDIWLSMEDIHVPSSCKDDLYSVMTNWIGANVK